MKMTEKTKRYLTIGGGAAICVVLIAAIGMQFKPAPIGGDTLPTDNPIATEIVVNPSAVTIESTEETELVIETSSVETERETDSAKPVDTRLAQTDRTEQSIQPEVTKPVEPEKEVKTDSTQKPDGTKVEAPPDPVEHEAVVTPTEPETPAGQPEGGDVQDGKIYLPGFGYIENSGPNQEIYAEDMYENGNKIGSMD